MLWWGALGGLAASPLVQLIAARTTHRVPFGPRSWPLIALGCIAAGIAIASLHLAPAATVAYAAAGTVAVAAAVVDATEHRLPNVLTYSLLGGGLAVLVVITATGGGGSPLRALAGAGIYGGWLFLAALTGVGPGDVKLAAAVGLWLGWISWFALIAGIVLGQILMTAAYFTGQRSWRPRPNGRRVPLGPEITAGFLAALLLCGSVTT